MRHQKHQIAELAGGLLTVMFVKTTVRDLKKAVAEPKPKYISELEATASEEWAIISHER